MKKRAFEKMTLLRRDRKFQLCQLFRAIGNPTREKLEQWEKTNRFPVKG
jgi:hypothetical protein